MATNELDAGGPVVARERLAVAAGAALLVSGVILVIAVLPAEFGVDPTGIGRRLGLIAMSDIQKSLDAFEANRGAAAAGGAIVVPQERAYQHETIDLKLGPRQSVEYKYRLDKGEALLFSWKTTGPVAYEFHAEPDGAPRGYAQSYEKGDGKSEASGTLTAPFPGIHGWYWENTTDKEVTVTLKSAGFYNLAHEFRNGQPTKNKTFQ